MSCFRFHCEAWGNVFLFWDVVQVHAGGDGSLWKQHCEAHDALPVSQKAHLSHIRVLEVA